MFAVHTRRYYRPYRQQWNRCRKIGGRYVVKHATEHWTLKGWVSRPKHLCADQANMRQKQQLFTFSLPESLLRWTRKSPRLSLTEIYDNLISPDVPALKPFNLFKPFCIIFFGIPCCIKPIGLDFGQVWQKGVNPDICITQVVLDLSSGFSIINWMLYSYHLFINKEDPNFQ